VRFLLLTQYFAPEVGAPQVRLAAMSRELIRMGHQVEVVTALPNHPTGKIHPEYRGRAIVSESWEGIPVHRVWLYPSTGAGVKRLANYGSFVLTSLAGMARAQRPDVLFVESPPLFLSPAAHMAARAWRIPWVFNVADLWPDSVRELGLMSEGAMLRAADRLEAWTYRHADFVNAVTEGIRGTLLGAKGVPEEKVLFLPNGVDTTMFSPADPDPALVAELGLQGKKALLYAGTLGVAQGLEVAIEAMTRLRDTCPELVLLFMGDGSAREDLERLASSRRLDNVRFLPPGPPEKVAHLYSVAFAGFASLRNVPLFEGARPSKIFPVMASGLPVVYSGAGEGARLVAGAGAGVVVPPEDPGALAAALQSLAADPERARALGANGRRHVEAHFGWGALVEEWLGSLQERMARSR
jgi:glycosyltransferase involved in cell wall biosynthesis